MARELSEFVGRSLDQGLSKQQIESTLLEAGWPRDEVASALGAWADVDFPVAVPRPRPYLSARDAFLYLVLFTTLYTFAIAWGKLLFTLVNSAFPDPTVDHSWLRPEQTVRWAIASLVVAFPAYFWLARRSYLAVRRNPAERTSRVRKWLTYITLFLTAAVVLCDLITLVSRALGGELSVRFVLKVLIVATISGGVFGFYLWLMRQDDLDPAVLPERHPFVRGLALATAIGVLASVVAGLVVVGPPRAARAEALDERRVSDLQAIHSAVDLFWVDHQRLPADLEEVPSRYLQAVTDPVSGEPYEYRSTGSRSYELCATFDTSREGPGPSEPRQRLWAHDAGRHCFELQTRD